MLIQPLCCQRKVPKLPDLEHPEKYDNLNIIFCYNLRVKRNVNVKAFKHGILFSNENWLLILLIME